MMTEQEVRELRDDLAVYCRAHSANPFTSGMELALTYILGERDTCLAPGICTADHEAKRAKALKVIRAFAQGQRELEQTKERARRQ